MTRDPRFFRDDDASLLDRQALWARVWHNAGGSPELWPIWLHWGRENGPGGWQG